MEMIDARWCITNINSGDAISFSAVKGEFDELLEAVMNSDWENFKEEVGDTLYFTYCWMYSKYKINLPMIGAMSSVKKFVARLEVWENIFKENGLEFNKKYLVNGSNYKKIDKVNKALNLARSEQIA
jgi:NTP pyrophosphatase (non-canonical NTP hydrolase)